MNRALVVVALAAACNTAATTIYSVQQIASPAGETQPGDLSLSNNGLFITVTYNNLASSFDYFLWNGNSFQSITPYNDGLRNYFEPAAMNRSGQIVGVASTRHPDIGKGFVTTNRIPVVRQPDGSYQPLQLPPGAGNAFVSAISDSGGVIGVLYVGGQFQPFVWSSLNALPTPVGPGGNSIPITGGLNTQGTYAIEFPGGTEIIVQNHVAPDT